MRIHSTYARAVTRRMDMTLGEAAADQSKPRSRSPHNRIEPHLGARCQAKDHAHCYSLHCTCSCHEVKP
jgi:hypothetical protein